MASDKWPRPAHDAPPSDDPRHPRDQPRTSGRMRRASDPQYPHTVWPASGWPPPVEPADVPPTPSPRRVGPRQGAGPPPGDAPPAGWPPAGQDLSRRYAGPSPDPRYPAGPVPDPTRTTDPRLAAGQPMMLDPRLAVDPRLALDSRLPTDPTIGVDPRHAAQQRPPARMLAIEAPRADGAARAPGPRRAGENTRSVHLPPPPIPAQQPLTTPIYRTSTFAFTSGAEHAAVLGDSAPGFSYSRIDNPTVTALCYAVAALEGVNLSYQAASQAFASGMAAISTVFFAFTRAGAHVLAPTAVYGGTYSFLHHVAANFGVRTEFVDMTDLGQVRAALRPGTSVVYAETLANPTVAVADLPGLARLAHEAGAIFVVDSTLAPPVICRPLEHGADLVLHSATKYFGGHNDVTGGVVTGHPELIKLLRKLRIDTGGSLGPDDAYTLRRGLETLPLRVRRQCATAQVFAAGLARHPAVSKVYYPGLTQHFGHALARRQFDAGPEGTRFGAIVTVAPYGGAEAGFAFADRLKLARMAASLGGTHTKVSHVASTTHRQMDGATLAAAGIDPASVRFSIGLEDAEDLLADAMSSLDSLGRR